jgi:sialic acid synthase SpsE
MKILKKKIGINNKTYFVADIAANHDGKLSRALKLIRLAAKAGADAAKFQHFKAETIVSDYGFKNLGKITHQKKWNKSVYQVYKEASINNSWTPRLKKECCKHGIAFMTSPYDLDYVDSVYDFIDAYKIGSGDINWHEIIDKISKKKKTTKDRKWGFKFKKN